MADVTDPAAELAKLLGNLSKGSQEKGSAFLANTFEVEAWSLEFYQIIFSIIQRIEAVRTLLNNLPGFEHLAKDINGHLNEIKKSFNDNSLRNVWTGHGVSFLSRENVQPLKMCSAFLRTHISYPDLTPDERETVVGEATTLLDWLREHQLEEADFIRQSLIDGLENFVFRMERLNWLGWGYPLESLKAVVMAYIALERGDIDEANAPNTAATVKFVGKGLKKIFEGVGLTKDIYDRADFALKAYAALNLAWHAQQGIAGLLPGSAS